MFPGLGCADLGRLVCCSGSSFISITTGQSVGLPGVSRPSSLMRFHPLLPIK